MKMRDGTLRRPSDRSVLLLQIAIVALIPFSGARIAAQETSRVDDRSDSDRRGLEIAREAESRTGGYSDFQALLRMELVGRDGDLRKRELEVSALVVAGEGERTLLVFRSPRDLAGTSLLSHAHEDGGEDQWLYLPSMKRVKRIASAKRSASFMGSEFAYEDVSSSDVDRFTWQFIGLDRVENREMYLLDRFPRDDGSGYSRQRVLIDRESYLPIRIEYFDDRGEHLKTLRLTDYAFHGPCWRAATMTMENHRTGRITRLDWSDFRFDTGLAPRRFTPDDLSRRGR